MMRSMYTGVSGLRVHQGKMDTIGNNIANVNTVGFKRGQVTFQEVFSQVTKGASAPSGGKGGTNPQQIGMGVALGSINTIHTVGPGQRTDNPTDLMIGGEGFFVVSDDINNNNKYYTRAGNFQLDRDGNLVTADGFRVLGYGADENGNILSDVTNIRINKSDTSAPTATERITFKGNLDSGAEIIALDDARQGELVDTVITDSLGNSYKVTFEMKKTDEGDDGSEWTMSLKDIVEVSTGNSIFDEDADGNPIIPDGVFEGEGILNFNKSGKLIINPDDPLTASLNFESIADRIKGTIGKDGNGTITIFDSTDPESTKNIHQYANETDFKPFAHGNTSGTLEGFSIDATGTVVGVFTNGERRALGQLMIAKFDNPTGLQKMGGNMFLDTRNSGEAQFGKAGATGYGPIDGGVLEMSNVDISLEFTEMITTQRGFQANSRIITTSDEMLQELVNMKR